MTSGSLGLFGIRPSSSNRRSSVEPPTGPSSAIPFSLRKLTREIAPMGWDIVRSWPRGLSGLSSAEFSMRSQAMRTEDPHLIRLIDYRPPDFLVDRVKLDINL